MASSRRLARDVPAIVVTGAADDSSLNRRDRAIFGGRRRALSAPWNYDERVWWYCRDDVVAVV
jgi:hypothetical protein